MPRLETKHLILMTINLLKLFFFLAEDCSLIMQQHKFKFKSYMDSFLNRRPKKDANLLNNSNKYYQQALCELVSEIQDVLMKDQAVYFMTQVRNRYREIVAEESLDNSFSVRSDRLQRRLLDCFGSVNSNCISKRKTQLRGMSQRSNLPPPLISFACLLPPLR